MTSERICAWLNLPPGVWPPDHYRLLGLRPGETDAARIEAQVHQRLETVRRYQLQDPDSATEAMNRLAQAFVCLTDPVSRRAYDAKVLPSAAPRVVEYQPEVDPSRQSADNDDPLAWLYGMNGVDAITPIEMPAQPVNPEWQLLDEVASASAPPMEVEPPAPGQGVEEALAASDVAQHGLNTKRALYHRIAQTRALQRAWDEAGVYLSDPIRKLTRPMEATELIYWMGTIRRLLADFPPLLGVAGRPGYLVQALAKQKVIVPTFQTLLLSQREALARDWQAGQKLLAAHRQFLRSELQALRRKSPAARMIGVVRYVLNKHPAAVLIALALLALAVALFRTAYLGAGQDRWLRSGVPDRTRPETREPSVTPGPDASSRKAENAGRLGSSRGPNNPGSTEKASTLPKVAATSPTTSPELPEPKQDRIRRPEVPTNAADPSSPGRVRCLAFLDSKEFIAGYADGRLRKLSLGEGPRVPLDKLPEVFRVSTFASCRKTSRIAFADDQGSVFVLPRVNPLETTLKGPYDRPIESLAFSADGERLAWAYGERHVIVHNFTAGGEDLNLRTEEDVTCVAVSADGKTLATGEWDGSIQCWSLPEGTEDRRFRAHEKPVAGLAFTPAGRLVSGGKDGLIALWDCGTEKPTRRVLAKPEVNQTVHCLAVSDDGVFLLASLTRGDDKDVQLWCLPDQDEPIWTSPPRKEPVVSLALSDDARTALLGQANGDIAVLDLSEPEMGRGKKR